jgi:twitching motility protein PilI
MAQREALRELQARLAHRLRAAPSTDRAASWLAVDCAGQGLLFPLAGAGEIFKLPKLLPVPHTQPWFLGVANLRGRLHGVADLAAFLGLRRPPAAGEPLPEASRVLALNPALGSHCALLVDRLAGLRGAGQLQAEADAADAAEAADAAAEAAPDRPRPAFARARWRDDTGRVWQEIDLPALAAHPLFLGISS